jgi:hypothetical protein
VRLPRNANAHVQVRESLRRLVTLLAGRPNRRIRLTWPLGRLIGDLADACAAGAEASANEALSVLEQDQRLARPNKLFLRLQYLAAFERWDDLEAMDELPDLIRLDRPLLASDALARLAMARLTSTADLEDFKKATADLGCLIGSVAAIRSAAGAQYYAYWSLTSGEAGEAIAARLLGAGWLHQARERVMLARALPHGAATHIPAADSASLTDLQLALDSGRLDSAIEVLALLPPSAEELPLLISVVTRTLSARAIRVLEDWRAVLGESAIEEALAVRHADGKVVIEVAKESLDDTLLSAFAERLLTTERAEILQQLRNTAVSRLMQAGALSEVVEVVRQLSRSVNSVLLSELIDLLLDMERDLFAAAGDVSGIQDLRLTVIETWALGDESGDRHRATRLLDLASRTLNAGVSARVFSEIAEGLRAAWDSFLTDADLPLGLEAIELLAASEPRPGGAVQPFALAILSRIGAHNARRIEPAYLETARALAEEFGLDLAIPPQPEDTGAHGAGRVRPPADTFVAIYSLIEPATARAAAIIKRWYPETRVETLAGKVASDVLKSAAKSADVLVIADRAAAHAATDALKAARAGRPIYYASGKGTASLVKAVLRGFDESFGGMAA